MKRSDEMVLGPHAHNRKTKSRWNARARRFPESFTLIELLVVVAIISILAALLMPALKRARDMGKQVVCLSNLHQISLGFTIYTDDNNGILPPLYVGSGLWTDPTWFHQILAKSVGNNVHVWDCPSQVVQRRLNANYQNAYGWYLPSYAYNAWLAGQSFSSMTSGFAYAQEQILLMDGRAEIYDNVSVDTYGDAVHNGRYNVLFINGRAANLTRSQIVVQGNWPGPPLNIIYGQ